MLKFSTMRSSISKKATKPISNSSAQTKSARKVELRPVYLDPATPAMADEQAEAYILSCGGRPMTKEEEKEFSRFLKPCPE